MMKPYRLFSSNHTNNGEKSKTINDDEPFTSSSRIEVDSACWVIVILLTSSHVSLNRQDRWGTTDDFTTSRLCFRLFSTALWDLANSGPGHSLMLSSHLFFCLPCLLLPFTVPCKMILARPDERETCPYHCSLRLFTMIRRSLVL